MLMFLILSSLKIKITSKITPVLRFLFNYIVIMLVLVGS